MAGETVRFEMDVLNGLLEDLARATGDVSRAMPAIAEALHFEVMEVFEQEGAVGGRPKWPDLAESTKKKRRKSTSYKILQDTTNLIGSIDSGYGDGFVEAFTGVPYATYHISKAPRRVIPLRDFFAIDEEAFLEEASDMIVMILMGRV